MLDTQSHGRLTGLVMSGATCEAGVGARLVALARAATALHMAGVAWGFDGEEPSEGHAPTRNLSLRASHAEVGEEGTLTLPRDQEGAAR